jgi:hypothetical protein
MKDTAVFVLKTNLHSLSLLFSPQQLQQHYRFGVKSGKVGKMEGMEWNKTNEMNVAS